MGLGEGAVIRHVLKNASPQVLAVMGLQFGYLMGGSILVETVFTWPGSGFLLNKAIINRDIPVLQGTILALSLIFVATNLVVDLLQADAGPADTPGMSKQVVLDGRALPADAGFDGAPATKVRGYWQSVGYRLRHDWVTLVFGAVVLSILLVALAAPLVAPFDPYAAKHHRPAEAVRLARPSVGHRRARPRHDEPADLWRPHLAADGAGAGGDRHRWSAARSA